MRPGRARSLTIALALVLGASAPVVGSAGAACAAAQGRHAGLVIDTGAHATSYCVMLDGPSVSGTHLIALASAQFGLAYRLGFGGRAVCMLGGVGAEGEDCFGAYPDFWGYFHGTGGGWSWATGSAADHQVADGDVEGWSWGNGDDQASHAPPPAVTIDDVCGSSTASPTPAPSPTPPPPPSPRPSAPATTAAPTPAVTSPDPSRETPTPAAHHHASARPSTSPTHVAAAPTSASPDVVRAAAGSPPDAGGPPLGGLVTLGAIAILGTGGWFTLRRRRRGAP